MTPWTWLKQRWFGATVTAPPNSYTAAPIEPIAGCHRMPRAAPEIEQPPPPDIEAPPKEPYPWLTAQPWKGDRPAPPVRPDRTLGKRHE